MRLSGGVSRVAKLNHVKGSSLTNPDCTVCCTGDRGGSGDMGDPPDTAHTPPDTPDGGLYPGGHVKGRSGDGRCFARVFAHGYLGSARKGSIAMTDPNDTDELALSTVDVDDLLDGSVAVMGAIWALGDRGRRQKRSSIREFAADFYSVDLSRDQVRYRVDQLREAGILEQDSYVDHEQVIHEFDFAGIDAMEDGETCHRALRALVDDDPADPDAETIIALAGRVGRLEARLDDLEGRLDLAD